MQARRVILSGSIVTVEFTNGETIAVPHASANEALVAAARTAAEHGTYVFDTTPQQPLAFL